MKRIVFTILSAALISLSGYVSAGSPMNPGVSKRAHRLLTDLIKSKVGPTKKMYSMAGLTGNLEYDFGKTSIRAVYYDKLDHLAKNIITNNNAVALRGYADSIGTFNGNWVISDKRAKGG